MAYILSLDVETTGKGVCKHFMTQLGAALVSVETGDVVASFVSYLAQPPGTEWEERCVEQFWKKHPERYTNTLEAVKYAPQPHEVMARFKEWVLVKTEGKNVTIVCDTAGFDVAWINHYLQDESCDFLLGYYKSPRDLSSASVGMNAAWRAPSASSCRNMLGMRKAV